MIRIPIFYEADNMRYKYSGNFQKENFMEMYLR